MKAEDRKSLAGRRILVTRPRRQAAELIARLEEAGAEAVALPTIAIIDPPDWGPTDRALARLADYDTLLLTSVNGVERFFARLAHHGLAAADLEHLETVCVGPKTARAAAARGRECQSIAKEYAAEGILKLFAGRKLNGRKFLFPRALKARELLPETLRRQGARVDLVPVYQTIFPEASAARLRELLAAGGLDLITLTSASTATNLARHCGGPENRARLRMIPVACIGPITAEAARGAGLKVRAVAAEYTTEGLLEAILRLDFEQD